MPSEPAGAATFLPDRRGLSALRSAAAGCQGCGLYRAATQTVFGEGAARARLVFIGEQPGDREDRTGKPFVGPAGHILDRAISDVGLRRADVYLTNVVKHFKHVPAERGKRRLHKAPNQREIAACRPWWLAELHEVRPELVVCLGATAAQALLGGSFRITRQRGEILPVPDSLVDEGLPEQVRIMATTHPSAVLRAPDRESAYADLRQDLSVARKALW